MKVHALAFLVLVALSAVSLADTVTYILPAPGIITDQNAQAAKAAALAVKGVVSAEAFVGSHTIEIEVMGPGVSLSDVVKAINSAGYTVGKPKVKKGGR